MKGDSKFRCTKEHIKSNPNSWAVAWMKIFSFPEIQVNNRVQQFHERGLGLFISTHTAGNMKFFVLKYSSASTPNISYRPPSRGGVEFPICRLQLQIRALCVGAALSSHLEGRHLAVSNICTACNNIDATAIIPSHRPSLRSSGRDTVLASLQFTI
jgi:hypothetical protein